MRTLPTPPVLAAALLAALLLAVVSAAGSEAPETSEPLPTVADKTADLTHRPGLLDLWIDEARGQVFLEMPAALAEDDPSGRRGVLGRFLWVEGLASGLGSNPVGLDRGQLGETRVVAFRRVGGKVVLEVENLRFRAVSDEGLERRAVEESFARSVVWAGEVVAEEIPEAAGAEGRGRVLVDLTPFLLSDAHGVVRRLAEQGRGEWTLDAGRSAVDPAACLAFPDNVELEALLTYTAAKREDEVGRTAAVPEAFTLVQHHSFIRLPDDGFTPRRFDPRTGFFGVGFQDYAAPLDQPLDKRFIARHRLVKKDPSAASSEPVEPIVFYVDRAVPEPVRSALVEGASWWAEAFEAAGFPGGFRVELLPPGVHPLDVRYNVVEWVHRSTRGWSFGGGIIDPRTGEIVKGHVNLGSLRVRQDRLLFEGLLGVAKTGTGAPDDPVELALARIRQLAAHEVGHALGLDHNFAASTYGRASVMDYPAPWVKVRDDGSLDVSSAYAVGVGAWDVQAIRWGYSQFPPGADEAAELEAMVRDGLDHGLLFLSDDDARPPGAAHPLANLWDNGADPVAELAQVMAVRRSALDRFGAGNLAAGRPLALLQEVLVPVYLYHRYQLQAALKTVGGLDYRYAVAGDGQPPARPVPGETQRRALRAVLAALAPAELDLPERVLELLPPRPPGHPANRELFRGAAAPAFDPLGAAAVAADLVVSGLTRRERAARLVDFARRDPSMPSLEEVLGALVEDVFGGEEETPRRAEIRRTVQSVTVAGLLGLAADPEASPAVRARTEAVLEALERRLAAPAGEPGGAGAAHRRHLAEEIRRFLERPAGAAPSPAGAPEAPPGDPIGGALDAFWGACSRGG